VRPAEVAAAKEGSRSERAAKRVGNGSGDVARYKGFRALPPVLNCAETQITALQACFAQSVSR